MISGKTVDENSQKLEKNMEATRRCLYPTLDEWWLKKVKRFYYLLFFRLIQTTQAAVVRAPIKTMQPTIMAPISIEDNINLGVRVRCFSMWPLDNDSTFGPSKPFSICFCFLRSTLKGFLLALPLNSWLVKLTFPVGSCLGQCSKPGLQHKGTCPSWNVALINWFYLWKSRIVLRSTVHQISVVVGLNFSNSYIQSGCVIQNAVQKSVNLLI